MCSTRNTLKMYPTNHSSSVNRISFKELVRYLIENALCAIHEKTRAHQRNKKKRKNRPRNDSKTLCKTTREKNMKQNRKSSWFSLLLP